MPVAQPPQSIGERILALKEKAAKVAHLRAQADAAINLSKSQVAQIDAELTKLGINPENCEQELTALEAQLVQAVTDLETQVAREEQECLAVLQQARQAQIIQ